MAHHSPKKRSRAIQQTNMAQGEEPAVDASPVGFVGSEVVDVPFESPTSRVLVDGLVVELLDSGIPASVCIVGRGPGASSDTVPTPRVGCGPGADACGGGGECGCPGPGVDPGPYSGSGWYPGSGLGWYPGSGRCPGLGS